MEAPPGIVASGSDAVAGRFSLASGVVVDVICEASVEEETAEATPEVEEAELERVRMGHFLMEESVVAT